MSNVEVELPLEKQQPFALRLSQIERNCKYDIENQIMRYVTNSRETLRMARVIREATKLLRIELGLASTVDAVERSKLQAEALPLLANMSDELKELLSPDAKEVIKELRK